MSEDESDLYPAYMIRNEAWYASVYAGDPPAISIEYASTGGGVKWEFSVEEAPRIGIQLRIFDDAWAAFTDFPAFFVALSGVADRGLGLDAVRTILDDQGFRDTTNRTQPRACLNDDGTGRLAGEAEAQ